MSDPSDIGEFVIGLSPIEGPPPEPPPYPRLPEAGRNAAGVLTPGVSPSGDLPFLTLWDVIISQYANSSVLTGILLAFYEAIGQLEDVDNFYDDMFNVDTASGYGLDVWGRIVGINRVLNVEDEPIFGFSEASSTAVGWSQGRFYRIGVTSNYSLNDQDFLRLILAKALSNISDASISSINRILLTLFPNRGNCWVSEGAYQGWFFGFEEAGSTGAGWTQAPFYTQSLAATMTMTYVFTFALSAIDLAIINSGVLPKPCGVTANLKII